MTERMTERTDERVAKLVSLDRSALIIPRILSLLSGGSPSAKWKYFESQEDGVKDRL